MVYLSLRERILMGKTHFEKEKTKKKKWAKQPPVQLMQGEVSSLW